MTTLTEAPIKLHAGNIEFSFLHSGDLHLAKNNHVMINQWIANPLDGSINNIYLRFHENTQIKAIPLLGVQSTSLFSYSDTQVCWKGSYQQVNYVVTFTLTDKGVWFWDVKVDGSDVEIDVIYAQDIGLADQGAIRSNEKYLSQYVDHTVFQDESQGYAICSRQNQPSSTGFPYIQQGALSKIVGYSTDGFQFFGKSYKETNEPEVLYKPSLANEVYQYEFAYSALQTEKVQLSGSTQFVFYGLFKETHPEAITELEFTEEVHAAWEQVKDNKHADFTSATKIEISEDIGSPLSTESVTIEEVNRLFPNRHQEEWDGDTLLSFFTDTHEHIVLKEKERLVERPHGHILMSGNNVENIEEVITTSSYMYGIFNSQLVVGNTSFNKFNTNARNDLNVMKTSGQRIYVKIDGTYHLLTMPSLFEIGFNYVRWYYKTENETFVITNFTTVDSKEVHLHVRTESGKAYRYLVTNQVTMSPNEYEAPYVMEQDQQSITFKAGKGSMNKPVHPELVYRLHVSGANFSITDEKRIAEQAPSNSASLVILELEESADWSMTVQGSLHGEESPFIPANENVEIERYREFFRETMNGFKLSQGDENPESIEKFNSLAWWYTHNMLVHYSVPHGLEQYGGAAWGTRDVCQGPVEYFMATQKYDVVKDIMKTVYTHQFEDDGSWPQWFMFDRYNHIKAGESHGDIIVWPLKVIGDYLNVTQDFSILQEKVPYTKRDGFQFTEETATIYDHLKKEIDYIKNNFLHDTYLSSYGDGDWDDTLQPANQQLKQFMTSSWTVSLTYQSVKQLAVALEKEDPQEAEELHALASGIYADFQKYMSPSDILPGFVYMETPGQPEKMVHPDDTKTGIQYRLLPMTRSMISELLTPEQAEAHYQVIQEHLYCPDGVRLMNRPANYEGGVSTHFQRAEQAANFGREVGLQYVHAHIRYVEAMAKLGKSEDAWKALEAINPVSIQKSVPNAEIRQSNAYFSSSDGKFNTRYEAQERFHELRTGSVPVKGGWRIYSSGPGIYMNQLISNVLGIRMNAGDLIIDPVLPETHDDLHFDFEIDGKAVTFIYQLNDSVERSIKINGEVADAVELSNPYRKGGLRIAKNVWSNLLNKDQNTIEIFM
ncbi:GH36-type glycosyl hydrolase domain-containing protein [Pseudogracilibacillus auburnensis]|uniref:GH36-type glycosyl hydrolase domain-containing protein n=1 Tax=Pseudogracilibacillus auburnensis TaxID=1494959 RepID=UPI001A967228|nr:cellobiose phosphorylase [Pseudogracilibacillus auburnensis]MBO1003988.1 cellobiose phosphorylase [Pseudogracilibacillus auburnensis]